MSTPFDIAPIENLGNNFVELVQDMPGILKDLGDLAGDTLSQIAVEDYMRQGGERGGRTIRKVSGRLAGAVRSGRTNLSVVRGRLQVQKIIANWYARGHEFGATRTVRVTQRMRRYAWRQYFETGDERWKGLAITKKDTITFRIPRRPFLEPALRDTSPVIAAEATRIVEGRITDAINRAANA